ncbi:hypothetical protein KC19_10G036600 [Ceratodon purpureus]|uniref:Uncharacterized protein n=1 Tax=Ceratodon purpureus TaxID=3225 RepID=A0A8T0GLD2_CERPU|nr:hypothetical protein KC19_10G036600 [Ceratodon purpureus]
MSVLCFVLFEFLLYDRPLISDEKCAIQMRSFTELVGCLASSLHSRTSEVAF